MAWLDDRLRDHPKIVRTSATAFRQWALALCYCSAHGTEGRLDEAVIALRIGPKIVEELVEIGLWDREEDGLWVHDWQEHNEARDQKIELRREQARERQKRHRDKVRNGRVTRDSNANVTRDNQRYVTRDTDRDSNARSLAGARPRHARDHDQEEEDPRAVPEPRLAGAPEPDLNSHGDLSIRETIADSLASARAAGGQR